MIFALFFCLTFPCWLVFGDNKFPAVAVVFIGYLVANKKTGQYLEEPIFNLEDYWQTHCATHSEKLKSKGLRVRPGSCASFAEFKLLKEEIN